MSIKRIQRGNTVGGTTEIHVLVIPRKFPDPTEDGCLLIHSGTQPGSAQSPALTPYWRTVIIVKGGLVQKDFLKLPR